MYIGIIAPTLERKHSPTKQRFELYHHVNTLTDSNDNNEENCFIKLNAILYKGFVKMVKVVKGVANMS